MTVHQKIRRVPAAKARQNFSRLLREVYAGSDPLVIEKGGIPVAALISPTSFERWLRVEEQRRERIRVLDELRFAARGIPPEEAEAAGIAAIDEIRHGGLRKTRRKSKG